jgi:hypothetical protein
MKPGFDIRDSGFGNAPSRGGALVSAPIRGRWFAVPQFRFRLFESPIPNP